MGSNPTLSAIEIVGTPTIDEFMAARACIFATTGREPRQARKGAAVAVELGAGVGLARTSHDRKGDLLSYRVLALKWRPRRFDQLVGLSDDLLDQLRPHHR